MHTKLELNTTTGSCALRCLLMELPKDCTLIVYNGTTCLLGSTGHYEAVDASDDISSVTIIGKFLSI